jgi:hypothetical protein
MYTRSDSGEVLTDETVMTIVALTKLLFKTHVLNESQVMDIVTKFHALFV